MNFVGRTVDRASVGEPREKLFRTSGKLGLIRDVEQSSTRKILRGGPTVGYFSLQTRPRGNLPARDSRTNLEARSEGGARIGGQREIGPRFGAD